MKSQRKNAKSETENRLRNWLSNSRRVVVAGVGNPLRKDDFVGVKIVRNLRNKVSKAVYLIECETVPESFIQPITEFNPTHVLVIDAAVLNQKPGSSELVESDRLANLPAVSTHVLPLQIFCGYLAETTGAKIATLAIQPEDAGFGEGLTRKVEKAAKHLSCLLSSILP